MEHEMDIFSGERKIGAMEVSTVNVAPEGLGFGDGSISMESRQADLGPETITKIESLVASPEILVPVSTDKEGQTIDDDGCGDGRVVSRVFEGTEEKSKSLSRPKVFGGGATMAASTRIGLGSASGSTLKQTFSDGISMMRDKMVGFGAHTDTHAHGDNCGCGAIDKAPLIVANAVKFQENIRATIEALGVSTDGLDSVEANFASYASSELGDYTGAAVMSEIIDNGKIVKELADDHKEVIVLLNMVEGYTIDQEKIREVSDGKAQAFAVDVWRVSQIAERLYADEPDSVRHQALLSELVYTLATAGTLTKGDLPVFVVSKQPDTVAA